MNGQTSTITPESGKHGGPCHSAETVQRIKARVYEAGCGRTFEAVTLTAQPKQQAVQEKVKAKTVALVSGGGHLPLVPPGLCALYYHFALIILQMFLARF